MLWLLSLFLNFYSKVHYWVWTSTTHLTQLSEYLTTIILPLYAAFGTCGLFTLTWSWLLLVYYYGQLVACSYYLCLHCPAVCPCCNDVHQCCCCDNLTLFITIIRSNVCIMVYLHVCAVYGLYEIWWFVGLVLHNVTGVCIQLLAICSLRYCLTITGVCLICLVFCMIILPVYITHTQ